MTDSFVLEVLEVVEETADACSVVLAVPPEHRETFRYEPGQFLTLAVPSERTGLVARSYSLSSAPHESDERLRVTVKRTPDGFGSQWVCDTLAPGHAVRVLPPAGIFTPRDLDADLLLLAGGSGITPVLSIATSALERGSGRVVLVYANRDAASVIFRTRLGELAAAHPERLLVVHWLESSHGLPTQDLLRDLVSPYTSYDAFVCGPTPFMKAATGALKDLDVPRDRRHQEKFASLGGNPFGDVDLPVNR